jgi:hypothetical protein
MSAITTVGTIFLTDFNYYGSLTTLPASFVLPKLDQTNASKSYNFYRTLHSSTVFTITGGLNVTHIINGCATPDTDRNTFSSNQPGYSSLDPNWQG